MDALASHADGVRAEPPAREHLARDTATRPTPAHPGTNWVGSNGRPPQLLAGWATSVGHPQYLRGGEPRSPAPTVVPVMV
jgi:hypothetical protein